MEIQPRRLDVPLKRPFTIARGTRTSAHNVIVEIHHDGVRGYGEAAPNARYDQSQSSALDALARFADDCPLPPSEGPAILQRFKEQFPREVAARCALESAIWDWQGRSRGVPLHQLLSIEPKPTAPSSYTISIGTPDQIAEETNDARAWPLLKLKLGGGDDDYRAVESLRAVTDQTFRVDANESWSERELAEKVPWLAEQGCDLVEQPLPAGSIDALTRYKDQSPLPLVADEDAVDLNNLQALGAAYHGVNIKLMKFGGISRSVAMIHAARRLELDVLLGCFLESSLGIAAAVHLAPLARWIDLDGADLMAEDPFGPSPVREGQLVLPMRPGLGVDPIEP